MKTPYPDLRHYSLREYGHRVGIYRFFDALDRFAVPASFAVSARLAERYPYLAQKLADRKDEVVCHGWSMNHPHHGEMRDEEEAELVKRSIEVLADATAHEVVGWLSPGKSQSLRTPDHLAANGIRYMCDWVNDELPYYFETQHGRLVSMPLSTELEDSTIVAESFHSVSEYVDQISDAFNLLLEESKTDGGRLLSVSVHPWLLGQPHRIHGFEAVLELITGSDGVWVATGRDIVEAWEAQAESNK
jgi:peptidoglycan/xylan/chitin deacetylase (PgdA/CDA1 family)